MRRWMCIVIVVAASAGGCQTRPVTNTPRSAIEQLLLSGAADLALDKFEMRELRGKKVYVDASYLSCYDKEYVHLATRVRFAEKGAIVVDSADEADYVVQIASGGVGTEFKSEVIGLPQIPIPTAGSATPEVSAYTSGEQTGIIKLLVAVFEKGRLVRATTFYAKCDREESFVFGMRYQPVDQVRENWDSADYDRMLDQGELTTNPAQ